MATIKEVAKKANVSTATVSRVLNKNGYVKKETEDKVLKIIKELNYTPNSLARALYKQKSNTIGVLIPDITNPFFSELYSILEEYAAQDNYQLFLFNSNYNIKKEREIIKKFNSNLIDSAIIISENLTLKELLSINIPIIVLDRVLDGRIPSISINNYQGGIDACNYLLKSNCRNIAHITGPKYNDAANERTKGFHDQVMSENIKPIIIEGDYNIEKMAELAFNLLQENPQIDGIFAGNDVIAVGVIKALARLNRKVRLIGFDGISLGKQITPELTTMSQPLHDISKKAIHMLVNEDTVSSKVFKSKLVIRET